MSEEIRTYQDQLEFSNRQLRTENEQLQVDNTELKSLLLWALEHINIPFHLFDENDQRNIWYNRVTEVTK